MRTAVILSGGGAKAAYEAGVLKALEDNNVRVDLVIGTSAGALNAVLYAVGETERLYNGQGTRLWQLISKKAILCDGLLSTLLLPCGELETGLAGHCHIVPELGFLRLGVFPGIHNRVLHQL